MVENTLSARQVNTIRNLNGDRENLNLILKPIKYILKILFLEKS